MTSRALPATVPIMGIGGGERGATRRKASVPLRQRRAGAGNGPDRACPAATPMGRKWTGCGGSSRNRVRRVSRHDPRGADLVRSPALGGGTVSDDVRLKAGGQSLPVPGHAGQQSAERPRHGARTGGLARRRHRAVAGVKRCSRHWGARAIIAALPQARGSSRVVVNTGTPTWWDMGGLWLAEGRGRRSFGFNLPKHLRRQLGEGLRNLGPSIARKDSAMSPNAHGAWRLSDLPGEGRRPSPITNYRIDIHDHRRWLQSVTMKNKLMSALCNVTKGTVRP